jgi:hypothetical protein
MDGRLLKAAFGLALGFALLIAIIVAQRSDDSNLRQFLLPPDGCPIPCWQGIRPGVTRWDEANQLLKSHPWVQLVVYYPGMDSNSGLITWTWSEAHPVDINANRVGTLWVENGVVKAIDIPTTIPFGQIWLLLQRPEQGIILTTSVQPRRVEHHAAYLSGTLELTSSALCPLEPSTFWQATVDVLIARQPVSPLGPYHLPNWSSCG